jgi:acyl dehydratase
VRAVPLDQSLVGRETPRQSYTILAEDVRQFADAIGDPNPLFREPERARAAGFPSPLAPPTFVTRFRIQMADWGLDPTRTQVLHGEQEYEYTRPLHIGDELQVWHRLASLRQSSRSDGMAVLTLETLGQAPAGGHLFTGRATVIVRESQPGAAASASARSPRASATQEGESIGPLTKQVTQTQIVAYADASGDHNPIHIDPAAARAVGLDGTIAHGMLSMAFLGQVVTDWLAGQPQPGGWLARLRVRFQAMVRPGDTLGCRGALGGGAQGGRQALQLWAENQRSEPVTAGDAVAVVGQV